MEIYSQESTSHSDHKNLCSFLEIWNASKGLNQSDAQVVWLKEQVER